MTKKTAKEALVRSQDALKAAHKGVPKAAYGLVESQRNNAALYFIEQAQRQVGFALDYLEPPPKTAAEANAMLTGDA